MSDGDEPTGLFSDLTATFGSQSDAVHTGQDKQPGPTDATAAVDAPTSFFEVPESDAPTGLIRRTPTGRIPVVKPDAGDAPTGLIRRTPTGSMPVVEAPTPLTAASPTRPAERAAKKSRPLPRPRADLSAACATATASVLSGWATAVMATMLIAGHWHTDQLFCVAVGFLTSVSAIATIGGQIAVLLRRRTGRILVMVGSVIALMTFGSLFVAGVTLPTIAYFIPVLPVAGIILTALPATGRWCTKS